MTDDYEEVDVEGPSVMCEGMELVANSIQGFGSWGRRVSRLGLFYESEE